MLSEPPVTDLVRRDHRRGAMLFPDTLERCLGCSQFWPCDAVREAEEIERQRTELSAAYEMIWYLLGQLVEAGRPIPGFIIDRIGAERLRAAGVPAASLLVDPTAAYATERRQVTAIPVVVAAPDLIL